ncbi:MAG: SusC/RagA family TonB-linked outer membrane protein [Bacteroidales bacterium]|nr:SusC/RagA family TonB-linked outer membrane protein [Bacteroidales bacterium]MBD5273897.1 SusC/RagA family TonB-linked outer membrane protein [Bacteroides sp.]
MRKLFLIIMTLVACSWAAMAQTTYRGTVVDAENNEPLVGATIMPIGGGQGAATDIDGKYSISVPSNVRQAKVTYVGYKEQVVNLTNNMTIKLVSTEQNLDDVVVVAYGTATKESLTGSVAVVGSKEIEDRPVTSVTAALEGNAPGVQVNNSTTRPGESPAIRIRGFNSFTSTAMNPLYVVDGVVYDGDPSDINPADIESMSVLKDAASCALYGNRGANGVILINTKRAKSQGKVEVSLQVRQGMYNRGLPFYDTLGADQWMETALAGWARGRYTGGSQFASYQDALAASGAAFVTSDYMLGTNIYDLAPNELFSPEGKLLGKILPGYTDLDWWDAVSRTGHRQEYNVNAAGATEKFDAFASIGYLKENGYMLQTDFERYNGRVVANYRPVSYFKMGTNISVSYTRNELGSADSADLNTINNPFLVEFLPPVQSYYAHEADGSIMMENGSPVWNTANFNKGNNVAWSMRLDQNDWTYNVINASVYGTAVIPYGFELTLRGSMMRQKGTGYEYSNNLVGSLQGSGGVDMTNQTIGSDTFMQTLTWNHDYGDHNVDVLLDHENYEFFYDMTMLRKTNQLLPGNYNLSNFENNDYSSQSKSKNRTESYLGRVRYNYDGKYYGEVSIRRDGTSKFASDRRWGTFWSVGGSWVINREKFMQNLNWVNYLKLRAAYGAVGNDAAASAYAYWPLYLQFNYGGAGLLMPAQLAANNIKWESTNTLDIALEGSLFNDRFNFSIGYFDKRNSDLLYNVTQPLSSGMNQNSGNNASILTNIGTMSNRGWELQFGVDILRTRDWNWNFNIDASFVQNKILKLPNGKDIPGQALFQGKSIYEKYTYEFAGVDRVTGNSLYYMAPDSPDYWIIADDGSHTFNQAAYETNVRLAKASGHYFEYNGIPMTDRTDYAKRRTLGTSLPTVYGSFGTNLSWKGINLAMLFTYGLGGKSTNGNYQSLMSNNTAGALHKDILNSWTEADAIPGYYDEAGNAVYFEHATLEDGTQIINNGDIDANGVPVNDTYLSNYNNASSSRWMVSNNYLTFKNLNINYNLPMKWVDALKLQGINVGFSVDNLFIATRQKGFNPQYSYSGGQGAYYVPSRVFSFQLNVKF